MESFQLIARTRGDDLETADRAPCRRRRRARRRPTRPLLGALALMALALALAAPARAASLPVVATESAHEVSFGSAVLTGSLNPNGSDTSYYFQYGVTRAYGGQTAIADAGAGTHPVKVMLPVAGLQPLTVYHYRLVGVNGAGATIGADATLLTSKVPLSLQILASPNPIAYDGDVLIQGTLSGTGNANREVVLQADPFGSSAGFVNLGNPELTDAGGGFSFPVIGLIEVTQFRVVSVTSPAVVSPVTVESVAVRVVSHIARARRSGFVRIFGTVTPAEDGMQVAILRTVHGRGVLVAGTNLRHHDPTTSTFSRVVPARRGVYRVLVRVTTGAQVSSYGQPLLIG
jgi:hypothetical protein